MWSDMYRTRTGHAQDTYRTRTGHIQDTYRTRTGHAQDMYRTGGTTYSSRMVSDQQPHCDWNTYLTESKLHPDIKAFKGDS